MMEKINDIKITKRDAIFGFLFSYVFWFLQILGWRYVRFVSTCNLRQFLVIAGVSIFPAIVFTYIYIIIGIKIENIKKKKLEIEILSKDAIVFLKYLIIILIFWFPVFLAYYPGVFSYDVQVQIPQTIGTYYTHHPLIHTLMLQFFYYIVGGKIFNNFNAGIACYNVVQSMIFAASFAYMLLFLYRIKLSKKIRVAILMIISIFPVIPLFAISTTKDIIFISAFLIAVVCICYWIQVPEMLKKNKFVILYIASTIIAILFRNNMIYALTLLIICLFIFDRKNEISKKVMIFSIVAIVIAIFINYGLKTITKATNGSKNELLAGTYQHIARVFCLKKNELSEEEISNILFLLPDAQLYVPYIADPIKDSGTGWDNKALYIKTYLSLFVKYPLVYLEAFLQNTLGYWYIFDVTSAQLYGVNINGSGYMISGINGGLGVERTSHFESLYTFLEKWFSENTYQNNIILFFLFSIALYFWCFYYCAVYSIDKKNKKMLIPLLYIFSYIFTILIAPTATIRYAFPIFCRNDSNSCNVMQ